MEEQKLSSGYYVEDANCDMESLLRKDGEEKIELKQGRKKIQWVLNILSILLCFGILIYSATLHGNSFRSCLRRSNAFSPLLDAIGDGYHDVRFEYSLWYESPYKGPPTAQVDEAWHELMQYGQISVTAEDIFRIGHNLSSVQYPASVGGGYLATASGTHAIHCLHYVWQDHYIDTSPEVQATKASAPDMYERHYEHCVDYIRQFLMCKFDTTIIPYSWVRDHQNPTPNGNTIHKCVSWSSVQTWLRNRAVKKPEDFEWHQPANALTLSENP